MFLFIILKPIFKNFTLVYKIFMSIFQIKIFMFFFSIKIKKLTKIEILIEKKSNKFISTSKIKKNSLYTMKFQIYLYSLKMLTHFSTLFLYLIYYICLL